MLSRRSKTSLAAEVRQIRYSASRIILLLSCLVLLIRPAPAQTLKDYIYLDGKLIAVESVHNSSAIPQPTCFALVQTIGFAGINPSDLDICNGANMKIWVRYNFKPWGSEETELDIENLAGTANASGRIIRNPLPQNTAPGAYVITAVRNDLSPVWLQLKAPLPQYILRPPQPQDFKINDLTSYEVTLEGSTVESAANSQEQTIEAEYSRMEPAAGEYWYFPYPMDSNAKSPAYLHPCTVGNTKYQFHRVRNQLDSYIYTDPNDPQHPVGPWKTVATYMRYTRGPSCPDFQVQMQSNATQTTAPGQTALYQFMVAPIRGFSGRLHLRTSGLPAGASVYFSQNPVGPNQTVLVQVWSPYNIAYGDYNFKIIAEIMEFDEGGWLSRSTDAKLSVPAPPPQPTCFGFFTSSGFAGIDTRNIYLCDAPNMTIEVQYTWVSWTGETYYGQDIAGSTDVSGIIWTYQLPQNIPPGTGYITAYKNVLRSDWVYPYPYPQYTVRPAKPTYLWAIPSAIQLPGGQWVSIANGYNQMVVEEVLNPNPPGGIGQYSLPMDYFGWWSTSLPCGVLDGTYVFVRVRNQLDSADDAWLWLPGTTQTILACRP